MVLKKTKKEMETHLLHSRVIEMYRELVEKYPNASKARVFETIAEEFNMTTVGIRNILIKHNEYVPRQN